MKKTTYINFIGGPGTGKSTKAAEEFFKMKVMGYDVELVTEVAKDFVWEERHKTLSIQPYVTFKQYKNLKRIDGKVDFVITDSPLLLGIVYKRLYNLDISYNFDLLIKELSDKMGYAHEYRFIKRKHSYNKIGRNEDEEMAKKVDELILEVLDEFEIQYKTV